MLKPIWVIDADVIDNKYLHLYNRLMILCDSKNRYKSKIVYYEAHHTLPTSQYGKNCSTVLLTPREHYLSHLLLTKFTEGDFKIKMLRAFHAMNNCGRHTSKLFERSRIEASKSYSGVNNPMYGVSLKCSEEKKQYMSKITLGHRNPGAKACTYRGEYFGCAKYVWDKYYQHMTHGSFRWNVSKNKIEGLEYV